MGFLKKKISVSVHQTLRHIEIYALLGYNRFLKIIFFFAGMFYKIFNESRYFKNEAIYFVKSQLVYMIIKYNMRYILYTSFVCKLFNPSHPPPSFSSSSMSYVIRGIPEVLFLQVVQTSYLMPYKDNSFTVY